MFPVPKWFIQRISLPVSISVNEINYGKLKLELLFGISQLSEGSLLCLCSEDESFMAVTIGHTLLVTKILSFFLRDVWNVCLCKSLSGIFFSASTVKPCFF